MSVSNLSTIFAKPIDRPIEGVIKADDEAGLRSEVEEYILTNELAKRLEEFLGAYTHYTNANGAWISGFFGSGKSHLLKMLALLLENREVEGASVLDLFLAKEEVKTNPMLAADLVKAAAIPSKSILFNIDQKADVISKTQIDALLAVFVKVFDETCGYYGKQGYIAQFERDLDGRGQYAAFKEAYRREAGKPWESGREQALLEGRNIAAAYGAATGAPAADAQGILDKYRREYKMSIEDFANEVEAYLKRQPQGFRLNFFVDEAGQYIANNVKLMTNLQTIAESLASKSRGRAWIVVTAQDEMDDVVGEMSKDTANDFSKIIARFATRMKLTSADVAEVVRRRLLQKNIAGMDLLTGVYEREHNNFKTLFDFADGSQLYRNYRSREEFVDSYPFVSYQFGLFQAALRGLSDHNAFEGKHRSVGERSLLSVFQQVAMRMDGRPLEPGGPEDRLATFDLMFEGIRSALKAQSQASILTAESNLDNPLAVKLLKALFLVKYVREFKATPRNLNVLLLPGFGVDLPARRKQLEEALNLLEQQTYIQRVGDLYEYLTNEEKDVEQEIKNTDVESDAVAAELEALFFDHVLKDRKIRYDANNQDYAFARRVDGQLMGRDQELAINLISPFHEHAGNLTVLKSQSMGRSELLVVLPPSDRLAADVLLYKRADKYIRQNLTTAQVESVRRILMEKQAQNAQRQARLRAMLVDLATQATLVVDGQELDISGTEPRGRIVSGVYDLLVRTYPNLGMLRGIAYAENDIGRYLRPDVTLYGDDGANLGEAEGELLAHIQSNQRGGLRTTLQSLVTRFQRKPYGWSLAAVQCNLAKLCARGKVELRRDANLLEDAALESALRNSHDFANVVITPQVDFTASQVRRLKEFYGEYFGGPPHGSEAKALAQETAAAFATLHADLVRLAAQHASFPFLAALDAPLGAIAALVGKPYTFYLADLPAQMDSLLDDKEEVVDPIRRFMGGTQRDIYAGARHYLVVQDANFSYAAGDEAVQLQAILADPAVYRGSRMQGAKTLLDSIRAQVRAAVAAEKAQALAKMDERWQRLQGMAEFGDLTSAQQGELVKPFNQLKSSLESQTLVAVIRDKVRHFDENGYLAAQRDMVTWSAAARRPTVYPAHAAGGNGAIAENAVPAAPIEYVAAAQLPVAFDKLTLADAQDVDRYLAALRAALLAALQAGKYVQIG